MKAAEPPIQNSEFRRRSEERGVRSEGGGAANSEFRIQNSEGGVRKGE